MFQTSGRNRAIGTHFPDVADLMAADRWAARLAVRFKPAVSADSLGARFGSTDEVCRPRLGFDANINRD